jgi:hypothetical protein
MLITLKQTAIELKLWNKTKKHNAQKQTNVSKTKAQRMLQGRMKMLFYALCTNTNNYTIWHNYEQQLTTNPQSFRPLLTATEKLQITRRNSNNAYTLTWVQKEREYGINLLKLFLNSRSVRIPCHSVFVIIE